MVICATLCATAPDPVCDNSQSVSQSVSKPEADDFTDRAAAGMCSAWKHSGGGLLGLLQSSQPGLSRNCSEGYLEECSQCEVNIARARATLCCRNNNKTRHLSKRLKHRTSEFRQIIHELALICLRPVRAPAVLLPHHDHNPQ